MKKIIMINFDLTVDFVCSVNFQRARRELGTRLTTINPLVRRTSLLSAYSSVSYIAYDIPLLQSDHQLTRSPFTPIH